MSAPANTTFNLRQVINIITELQQSQRQAAADSAGIGVMREPTDDERRFAPEAASVKMTTDDRFAQVAADTVQSMDDKADEVMKWLRAMK